MRSISQELPLPEGLVDSGEPEVTDCPPPAGIPAGETHATPKKKLSFHWHKHIVTAYRIAGFTILTAILVGLVSYISSQLFFLFNRTWIAPTIVSPSDEHVVQVSTMYAERAASRDKIIADRAALAAQLDDARRTLDMNVDYQQAFERALQADLSMRRTELAAVKGLASRYQQARGEIERANQAFADMSQERLKQEKQVGLIEEDQYLMGNYELAQIAHANLSLTERETQLNQQLATLRRETEAFQAALPKVMKGAISFEILRLRQELSRSILDAQRARANAGVIEKNLGALDSVIKRYDDILAGLAESPYLKATQQNMTIAFVPYDNLHNAKKDDAIYACRVRMLVCRKVGKVISVLGSEVVQKHPLANDMLRGQMVQVELADDSAAKQRILFLERAPLLF